MARRRYTDEFRASAVVMMVSLGWPDAEGVAQRVANHLNVPRQTLTRWATESQSPAPIEVVQEKRKDLVALIEDELHAIFGEFEHARGDASYGQLATAAGILTDKLLLLRGHPTDRVEYVNTDSARQLIVSRISEYASRNGQIADTQSDTG